MSTINLAIGNPKRELTWHCFKASTVAWWPSSEKYVIAANNCATFERTTIFVEVMAEIRNIKYNPNEYTWKLTLSKFPDIFRFRNESVDGTFVFHHGFDAFDAVKRQKHHGYLTVRVRRIGQFFQHRKQHVHTAQIEKCLKRYYYKRSHFTPFLYLNPFGVSFSDSLLHRRVILRLRFSKYLDALLGRGDVPGSKNGARRRATWSAWTRIVDRRMEFFCRYWRIAARGPQIDARPKLRWNEQDLQKSNENCKNAHFSSVVPTTNLQNPTRTTSDEDSRAANFPIPVMEARESFFLLQATASVHRN